MTTMLRLGLAAALAGLALAAAPAQAFDLKGGGQPKLKPTKAQLGIISPAPGVCPGAAKLTAWVFTNKPGTIDILIVKKGGQVYGPYPVTTVAAAGGKAMGTYVDDMLIAAATDAQYRVVIPGSPVHSNWAPLTAC